MNRKLNRKLSEAAMEGDLNTVEELLQQGADPSDGDNFAIRGAAQAGRCAVVELLLQDPRVDPSADNNYAIQCAIDGGHLEVADRLLKDPRVDPSASNNYAMLAAADYSYLDIVEILLQDTRVNPSAIDNCAVQLAAEKGHVAVVDRLFRDPRVYATVNWPAYLIKHIRMIKSRSTEVCIALQDLDLPALITLKILNALIPNTIRMWAKWELITKIKHFHN